MKKGLILEGGAMRGMYTAGILDVLMENGIVFDGLAGVSAGAVFGCNYKSGQIGRTIRYNKKYGRDKRYCSLSSLIKTGDLYGADFCYRLLPEELDVFDKEAFNQNPMAFYVVSTDVETGKAVYHLCERADSEYLLWFRASASLPLAARIVEVGGKKMLDGGIADSIPLRFMEGEGYDRNIVILTRPADYRKKKNSLMPLMKVLYRKYPKFIEALANRHNMYNETLDYIAEREKTGEVLVLRPEEPLPISRVEKDPGRLQRAYNIGRDAANKQLSEIKAFLEGEK